MKTNKIGFRHTLACGYISFITQAIVNNFAPLLFVTFQRDWGITLGQLAFISTYNFVVQLLTDIASAKYAEKIGVRRLFVFAHAMAAAGFISLGTLPFAIQNRFAAIVFSITLYAIGGGLIEVLASPIVENCPTKNKVAHMSLLHSFYCWGQMLAVVASTVWFSVFGIENWRYAALAWAVIPLANAVYLLFVPFPEAQEERREKSEKLSGAFKDKYFLILIVMMLAAGSCELAMAQWASAFAESSLHISKTQGDLLGPCFFALCMGVARLSHTALSRKIRLEKYILMCAALCLFSYLLASLSPLPSLSLLACGICGFSVGVMWPGTYSLAAKMKNKPSTAMFALLALAGDCGCSSGPMIVGAVSELFGNELKAGLAAASVFPVIMIAASLCLIRYGRRQEKEI